MTRLQKLLALFSLIAASFGPGLTGIASAKATRTFDFHVTLHCHPRTPAKPNYCDVSGWSKLENVERSIKRRLQQINRVYRDVGISFRYEGFDLSEGSVFSQIQGPGDKDPLGADSDDFVRTSLLHYQAGLNPGRITLFLLPDTGICWSAIPPARRCNGGSNGSKFCVSAGECPGGSCDLFPLNHHGFFCTPGSMQESWAGGRGLLAHELGHHLCLSHTFTLADPGPVAGSCNPPVNHDGDGLQSTPPDPGPAERIVAEVGTTPPQVCSIPPAGGLKDLCTPSDVTAPPWPHDAVADCHDWCEYLRLFNVTPDSPAPSYCLGACFKRRSSILDADEQPSFANVMSYYEKLCAGPYVILPPGQIVPTTVEALTSEQATRIEDVCLATIPERMGWIDVCEGRGDDTDHDGFCDFDDPCPLVPTTDEDGDGDGVPNGCDLCKNLADPVNLDTDHDGIGDVCDPNDDNDACLDDVDQHPLEAAVPVGAILYPGCPIESEPVLSDESLNSDPDGLIIVPDCQDLDDDGDGLPDAIDPCPILPGDTGCIVPGIPCPPQVIPWKVCQGPSCGPSFDLVLVGLISPVQELVFRSFQIVGDEIVISSLPDRTLAETLGALAGGAFSGFACTEPGPCLALEIRSEGASRPLAEVARFRPQQVLLRGEGSGPLLRLAPTGGDVVVRRVWGAGVPEAAPLPDGDADGIPDPADGCLLRFDPSQHDADGDGFGDACDLDLDQSGLVSWSEFERVTACDGVDLGNAPDVILEEVEASPLELEQLSRHALCGLADLDENRLVDARDRVLAQADLGSPPGPSGREPEPPVIPVEDPLDPDADLIGSSLDNCPAFANPEQHDVDANGIGDPCECGDQTGDGRVDVRDLIAINLAIFDPRRVTPLCDTNDDRRCDVSDILGANYKIFGRPAYCARFPAPQG